MCYQDETWAGIALAVSSEWTQEDGYVQATHFWRAEIAVKGKCFLVDLGRFEV